MCSAIAAPPSWIERRIAERDAAKAYLTGTCGFHVERANPGAHAGTPTLWRVSTYAGQAFDDSDLIALARHHGWRGAA
jgi:hypothetical protein